MDANIDEYIKYIVRDKSSEALIESIIPIVDCILESGCKWYGNDEESAEQIAECMCCHLDYSDFTSDEFEYALKWVNYFCALKYAYINGLLKEDEEGHLHVPKEWIEKAGI